MTDEMFIKKYEELLDKGYCNCNEMNCIDNDTPRKIVNIAKNLLQENQELKKQLEETNKTKIYIDAENIEERYCNDLYQDYLEKENQELKNQLENCYCNRTDCSSRIKDSKKYDGLVQKVENQQNEFRKWLENEIKACELTCDLIFNHNKEMKIYKEILSKYKEITGVKDETENE